MFDTNDSLDGGFNPDITDRLAVAVAVAVDVGSESGMFVEYNNIHRQVISMKCLIRQCFNAPPLAPCVVWCEFRLRTQE